MRHGGDVARKPVRALNARGLVGECDEHRQKAVVFCASKSIRNIASKYGSAFGVIAAGNLAIEQPRVGHRIAPRPRAGNPHQRISAFLVALSFSNQTEQGQGSGVQRV